MPPEGFALFVVLMLPFLAVCLGLLGFMVLHGLMPPSLLQRYWRSPYFRPAELALFTGTPLALMRTAMLLGAIAFPRLGERRGLADMRALAPPWLTRAAKVLILWTVASMAGVLIVAVGALIHEWMTATVPPWRVTTLLLVGLGCFLGVALYQRWRMSEQARRSSSRKRSGIQ